MAIRKDNFDDNYEQASQKAKLLRFAIISPELQQRIVTAARKNNLSPDTYIEHVLDQAVPKEESTTQQPRHVVPDDIMEHLQRIREQVIRDSKGQIFEDSAEVLRRQREERAQYLDQLREQQ